MGELASSLNYHDSPPDFDRMLSDAFDEADHMEDSAWIDDLEGLENNYNAYIDATSRLHDMLSEAGIKAFKYRNMYEDGLKNDREGWSVGVLDTGFIEHSEPQSQDDEFDEEDTDEDEFDEHPRLVELYVGNVKTIIDLQTGKQTTQYISRSVDEPVFYVMATSAEEPKLRTVEVGGATLQVAPNGEMTVNRTVDLGVDREEMAERKFSNRKGRL